MNRTNLTISFAVGLVLWAQGAIASSASESPPAEVSAIDVALGTGVADKPAETVSAPAKPALPSGKRTAAKPISAWRAAYIAQHHHEPPVKAK